MEEYYQNTDLLLEDLNGVKKIERLLVWELQDTSERVEKGLHSFSIISGICYLPLFNHSFKYNTFSDYYFFESILWSNVFIILFFYPKKRKDVRLIIALVLFLIWLFTHNHLLSQHGDFSFQIPYIITQIGFYVYVISMLCVSIYNSIKVEKIKFKIFQLLEN